MNRRCLFCTILLAFLFLVACEKDKDSESTQEEKDYEIVNNWIYEEMSKIYLWNNYIPQKSALNFSSSPDNFYTSILYKYNTAQGDRFSRIEGTHLNIPKSAVLADDASTTSDIGFEYGYIQYVDGNKKPTGDYAYLVLYVKKGTYAETSGLKRGHIIGKVDGVGINSSNRFSLLYQNKSKYKLTVSDFSTIRDIDVPVTYNYEESPIHYSNVYTKGNKVIGYVVYNEYNPGLLASRQYDVKLMQIFQQFKDAGVNNLVLDLRYNGGGYTQCANYIVSALVPSGNVGKVFEIKTYNPSIQKELDKLPDTDKLKISYMFDYLNDKVINNANQPLADIPHLGDQLEKVYILATGSTASASELTINALRPYIGESNVVIVGEETLGKNVGSWPIYEEDDSKNTYVLWPIIFKSHNKDKASNYDTGFPANIEVDDAKLFSQGEMLKELGDENETMLAAAIGNITGAPKSITSKSERQLNFIIEKTSLEDKKDYGKMAIDPDQSLSLIKQLKSLKEE